MTRTLIAFAPVAALLSLAPGPATALVARNAALRLPEGARDSARHPKLAVERR